MVPVIAQKKAVERPLELLDQYAVGSGLPLFESLEKRFVLEHAAAVR